MIATTYPHIAVDHNHVPYIAGTSMKLVELILDNPAYGWRPEELHFQHPSLSMGQIYSALAYYWDHKELLDEEIERRLAAVDHLQQTLPPARLQERLRAKGLL